jgi:hypothetical protein
VPFKKARRWFVELAAGEHQVVVRSTSPADSGPLTECCVTLAPGERAHIKITPSRRGGVGWSGIYVIQRRRLT